MQVLQTRKKKKKKTREVTHPEPYHKKERKGDFPGGPAAGTLSSQCRGPGFNPWSGNRPHRPQLKDPSCHNKDGRYFGVQLKLSTAKQIKQIFRGKKGKEEKNGKKEKRGVGRTAKIFYLNIKIFNTLALFPHFFFTFTF